MSHDVHASTGISREERERLFTLLRIQEMDDTWCERYDQYDKASAIARLSRSGANPVNVMIYRLLGCEQVHAGCSGDGSTISFAREEIADALIRARHMAEKGLVPLERERNAVDDLVEMLTGKKSHLPRVAVNVDIEPEIQFLENVLMRMLEDDREAVDITFA